VEWSGGEWSRMGLRGVEWVREGGVGWNGVDWGREEESMLERGKEWDGDGCGVVEWGGE
jgi:hypothetical protein